MFAIIGIVVVFGAIVAGYLMEHGNLKVLVQPAELIIIGGAARLPFLWVLLGILGGLETFGIIGLFLGPAIMAALISLWRDLTETPSAGGGPAREA